MGCCKMMMADKEMQDSASKFGFEPKWIADMVEKYGPEFLPLVLEAMRQGFSKELVIEIIQKLGPVILEILVNVSNKQKMGVVIADNAGDINISLVEMMLEKYLPILLEKYGPQLLDLLKNWLLQYLQSLPTQK